MNAQEIEHLLHYGDLLKSFKAVSLQAGGGNWNLLKNLPFEEVMRILAPNGFRFSYVGSRYSDMAEQVAFALTLKKK